MATDLVDAVIVELKKAAVFSSRVSRGWPAVTTLQPLCGVSEVVDGERGIDHHLASWGIQVDSWAKSPSDLVAMKAAIKVVADLYHSTVTHRCLPEASDTHIVSTFTCLGGCLLYTSDAADEEDSVDLGGRRI